MIIRVKHSKENPYIILNKNSLWNENLSLEAVGLWARLLSRPDDWVFYVSELCKSCKCGETKMLRLIKELIKEGYIFRVQKRNEDGKYTGFEYFIFERKMTMEEIKIILPHLDFPGPGDPGLANQGLLITKEEPSTKEESVCIQTPVGSENQESQKEELIKESLELPPKLTKRHTDGHSIQISLETIFFKALKAREDWSTREIHEAWKILNEYKGQIREPFDFIKGTIRNLRTKKRTEYINNHKVKECKSNKSQINPNLNNCKQESSEKGTEEPVCLESFFLRMRQKR